MQECLQIFIDFYFQIIFLGIFAKQSVKIKNAQWVLETVVAAVITTNVSVFFFTFFRESKVSNSKSKYLIHQIGTCFKQGAPKGVVSHFAYGRHNS